MTAHKTEEERGALALCLALPAASAGVFESSILKLA